MQGQHPLALFAPMEIVQNLAYNAGYTNLQRGETMAPPKTPPSHRTAEDTGLAGLTKVFGLSRGMIVAAGSSDPSSLGRVQILLPDLDPISATWAAVAHQPGAAASDSYEVGDEVIVGFEGGNASYPVVLGRLAH